MFLGVIANLDYIFGSFLGFLGHLHLVKLQNGNNILGSLNLE